MWAQLMPLPVQVPEPEVPFPIQNEFLIHGTPGLEKFAMQVDDPGASGFLVQIVHILGQDGYIIMLFQAHQGLMARVGGGLQQLPRSEEHTSELQSRENLVCRLLLEK